MDACSSQNLAEIASSFGNIGFLETYFKLRSAEPLLVIKWCQFYGLIATEYMCPRCARPMKLIPRKDLKDKFSWTCRVVGGNNPHHIKRSIRSGTWFETSNLNIPDILTVSFMWCAKLPVGFIVEQLEIAQTTVITWSNFCREVCFEIYITEERKIGGPGIVVEIAESKFGERKFNRGKNVEGQWVFGGIEKESGRCFFYPVEDRTRENLLLVIHEFILPGTIIVSSCWREYNCHSHEDFIHLEMSHSLTYLDPEPGIHTNSIRGTWSAIKRGLPRFSKDGVFDSYLAEYIWRKSSVSSEEKMKSFFAMVVQLYPPYTKDPNDVPNPNKKKRIEMSSKGKTGHEGPEADCGRK